MKNKTNLVARLIIYAIIFTLILGVAKAHVATIEVEPKLIVPGESYFFDVTFYNEFDAVDEIRITGLDFYDDFVCDEKEGWELNIITSRNECHYIAINETYFLMPDENETFFYFATISQDANGDCIAQMQFESRDLEEHWEEEYYEAVIIDRFDASIEKTMFGTYRGECPPNTAEDDCYVKGDGLSGVTMEIFDTGDICPNYDMVCNYEVWWEDELIDEGEFYEIANTTFNEDSNHTLIISCVDGFGNELFDEELFQVDMEPPTTEKIYGEPLIEKCDEIGCGEWISTTTDINLTAEDEKTGVDKTYWRTTLVDDTLCYNQEICQPDGVSIIGKIDLNEADKLGYWEDYVDGTYTNKVFVDQKGGNVIQGFNGHRTYEFAIDLETLQVSVGDNMKLGFYTLDGTLNAKWRIANHYPSDNEPSFPWADASGWFSYELSNDGTPISVDGDLSDWSGASYLFTECDATNQSAGNSDVEHCFDAYATVYDGVLYVGIDYTDDTTNDMTPDGLNEAKDAAKIMFATEKSFEEYDVPFNIGEESCHLIEFYSVDLFGYEEELNWQCAFVDNTAPNVTKIVGEPKVVVNNETIFITQETPITLSCEDVGPHPVNDVSLEYRYRISDDCQNWGNWSEWSDSLGTIYFNEDSCHELEYYCEDAVGNMAGIFNEIDIVDTQAPIINKTIQGPYWYDKCPIQDLRVEYEYPEECLYVDNATTVIIDVIDQEPHPVGNVTCNWEIKLNGEVLESVQNVAPPFELKFPEESEHWLMMECWDALGNTEYFKELFIADHTPPVTTKEYSGPQYSEDTYPKWINSLTNISLSAYDPQPHPSGVNKTYYRVTRVADEYCEYNESSEFQCANAQGNGEFVRYESEFNIGEDSCHLIEYYSVDNVEKAEETKKQCVYVDNQGPLPNKTIGLPHTKFNWDAFGDVFYDVSEQCWNGGEDEIECWKTTILTPLYLECNDPQPHPVDGNNVCFKVGLDGDDATPGYCEKYQGGINEEGYCCVEGEISPFYFDETTYHNLDFYCTDTLGNIGPKDDEKFKVEETSFTITLNKKWNLISTPVKLLDDSMDEVFLGLEDKVKTVWTYDAFTDEWFVYTPDGTGENDNLYTMLPGWGYWLFANDSATLVIGGSLFSPAMTPPSKQLKGDAWNLIGYYGADGKTSYTGPTDDGKPAKCVLFSLSDNMFDIGWSSLMGYWEPYNPGMWMEFDKYDTLDPGAGYWVLPAEDGVYAPTTTCDGLWS